MAKAKKEASKSPKTSAKKTAPKNGNGSTNGGGKVTNAARIVAAWEKSGQVWPPAIGDKVRLFVPKDLRGKVAKVIAVGDETTKASTRKAPEGKARVMLRADGDPKQFAVSQTQVFPREYKLKDLATIV